MTPPKPSGPWFMVSCAKCGLVVGWTRAPLPRPFFCIPHFDEVAHLPDDDDIIAYIDALRAKADAERPWFIADRPTNSGLSVIEDGRTDGMFPVTGETHEIELIVAMHNAWPVIRDRSKT